MAVRAASLPGGEPARRTAAGELAAPRLRGLLVILALLVLPHLFHLHWSHTALFLGFWGWRWLGLRRPAVLPRGPWLPLLTLAAAGVVIVSRHGAIDLTTSTGLFVAGLGLKLMELNSERDLYFVVFLGWFVALTQFLYDQSLAMAAYAFAAAAALTAVLVQVNAAAPLPWRAALRSAAGLLLPALPLMAGLFLFFPRPHGGFFRLPFDARATTGLAEVLEPGAIASLATSYEVAFRVDFDGDLPPPDQRYWRAQVFWRFDGRRWLPHPAMQQPRRIGFAGVGKPVRYQITVEPHHRRWLFSLGIPAAAPERAWLTREGVLMARAPVDERIRYAAVSYPRYRFPPLTPLARRLALQLPGPPDPRVQALVAELRRGADGPRGFAAALLDYFRTQGFRYTLHPGTLGGDPVAAFLFDTRAGFCEHYAGAAAYLLRAAGIPARIVGGYLGGFVNPRGRFLEVYQANAHAWVEYWDGARGWVRLDPTEAVAPRYVEQVRDLSDPLSAATPPPQPATAARSLAGARAGEADGWRQWVRGLLVFWSALDHRWHLWVLSYDREAQARLLAGLRGRWPGIVLALAAGLWLWGRRGRASRQTDPLLQAYQRFLRRLARQGLHKHPHETPTAFARRAAAACPQEAERILAVTAWFVRGRYGKTGRKRALREMEALLGRG